MDAVAAASCNSSQMDHISEEEEEEEANDCVHFSTFIYIFHPPHNELKSTLLLYNSITLNYINNNINI